MSCWLVIDTRNYIIKKLLFSARYEKILIVSIIFLSIYEILFLLSYVKRQLFCQIKELYGLALILIIYNYNITKISKWNPFKNILVIWLHNCNL